MPAGSSVGVSYAADAGDSASIQRPFQKILGAHGSHLVRRRHAHERVDPRTSLSR